MENVLPKRSLMADMNAEKNKEVRIRRRMPINSSSGDQPSAGGGSPSLKSSASASPPRKNRNDGRPPPQDRSNPNIDTCTTSISARSIGSDHDGSKCSTATPNLLYTTALPVTSPPFPLISPADGRAPQPRRGRMGTKQTTTNSYDDDDDGHSSSVLLSPPKMKTAAACKAAAMMKRKQESPAPGTCSSLHLHHQDIRKEIHELTCQFAKLERESQQRRAILNLDPQDRFDESLDIMGQKANAMVDALHRNYIQLSQLSKENLNLKQQIKNHNIHPENISNENEKLYDEKKDPNDESKVVLLQQRLERLDPSDDYVKRTYPSVPKTPGTMFTTELVEVMSLDVGDHAYLAEIMDRQWNTSTDYRPPHPTSSNKMMDDTM